MASENFDYNNFEYWTYNGFDQVGDAWYMMTLPKVYAALEIWTNMFMPIL